MTSPTSRRRFIKQVFIASLAPSCFSGRNISTANTTPRIGFLIGAGYAEMDNAFTGELKKRGYTEGKNITIERRFSKPNSSDGSTMAAELAQMDLTLIVVAALPLAIEVRKNNPKMPMVIATCPGMVSNGFAESMERPGSIYTGMDELPKEVTAKRLKLLKEVAPSATRVALLSTTPGTGGHEIQLFEAEKTATALGIEVRPYRAASLQQLEKALNDLKKDGMNGLLSFQGGLALSNRDLIVNFATQNNLPAIYNATLYAEAGGLMSWAPDLLQQFREAAHYVSKILTGSSPGDLPVKQPGKYYLTLNSSAAKKLGITFPARIMAEANKIL